jgi:hypothetical protein
VCAELDSVGGWIGELVLTSDNWTIQFNFTVPLWPGYVQIEVIVVGLGNASVQIKSSLASIDVS